MMEEGSEGYDILALTMEEVARKLGMGEAYISWKKQGNTLPAEPPERNTALLTLEFSPVNRNRLLTTEVSDNPPVLFHTTVPLTEGLKSH